MIVRRIERLLQGRLLGRMEGLGFQLRAEARLTTLTSDVVNSSAIEGERLDAGQVRSSIAWRLGMDFAGTASADRNVEGVVEMMLDATQQYSEPLAEERLFAWHGALFPTGRSGMRPITVGAWRPAEAGAMQAVSEHVHFEASSADRLKHEMAMFLKWFETRSAMDPAPVNERRRLAINRLLDGFEGKLSTSKYAKLTKCSADTALRDIKDLIDRRILVREASGGRSTSYRLNGLEDLGRIIEGDSIKGP
ncbi:MAG: DUF4172 domain-containing protein [Terrimicrobiaceae bacterium]